MTAILISNWGCNGKTKSRFLFGTLIRNSWQAGRSRLVTIVSGAQLEQAVPAAERSFRSQEPESRSHEALGGSALVERCLACEAVVNKEESQLRPVTCLRSLVFERRR
jgi:hypothetical protein